MKAREIDRLIRKLYNAETLDEAHMAGDAIRNAFEDKATMLERFTALADELEGLPSYDLDIAETSRGTIPGLVPKKNGYLIQSFDLALVINRMREIAEGRK